MKDLVEGCQVWFADFIPPTHDSGEERLYSNWNSPEEICSIRQKFDRMSREGKEFLFLLLDFPKKQVVFEQLRHQNWSWKSILSARDEVNSCLGIHR